MGTPNKSFAIFLILLGWLALLVALSFASHAVLVAYPAWWLLVRAIQFGFVVWIGFNMPRAFYALA